MRDVLITFDATFFAILQVFLVILAAGALVRLKVISQSHIQGLTAATVVVFLPCMTFANITQNFRVEDFPRWWLLPLSAVAMVGVGLALAGLAFARELPQKRNMLALACLQNAGYLVLPIGQALFPDRFDGEFSVYCFLYILGLSPLLWSLGKHLCTAEHGDSLKWRSLNTPPFVACLLALFFVFTGLRRYIPAPANEALSLLGKATVPVATFVLGASLGSIHVRIRPYLFDASRALLIKMFLIPAGMILVLRWLGVKPGDGILGAFFVIQAASAPATALILQVRHYGGDEQKIGSVILMAYVLAAITIPLWYAIWLALA